MPTPDVGGMFSPQAGSEAPFETLGACHQRVRRMLRQMQWLRLHLAAIGRDPQARRAAQDLVCYFDRDVALHHEDEEIHVFPPLLAAGLCVEPVYRLQREHREMAGLWPAVRGALQRVDTSRWRRLAPAEEALLEQFMRLYDWHMAAEDELVFPAAASCLDATALAAVAEEMAHRRGTRRDHGPAGTSLP